mgnify:CR=1 FL=1
MNKELKKEMGFKVYGNEVRIKEYENRYSVLLPIDFSSDDSSWSEEEIDKGRVQAYADKTMKYLVDEGFINSDRKIQVHIAVKKN